MTEGSFDAFMWQALETKARFISQVMSGDCGTRRAEDIGGQELSYAEVKAIASGNPAVLTLAEADAELQRLASLKKNHADEQYLARRNLRDLPETIARHAKRLADLAADMATMVAHADGPITVGNRTCRRDDAPALLGSRLESVPELVLQPRRIELGLYRGLRFGLSLHPQHAPDVYLEGAASRHATLSREFHGPRAILNAVERLAGSYESQGATARSDLAIAEGQLRDYEARLGKPFSHDAYKAELTELRDWLKLALSGAATESGNDPLPPAHELADRIRALKESQTIESAPPPRQGRRSTAAERPVTARIRERYEMVDAESPMSEGEEGAAPPITEESVGAIHAANPPPNDAEIQSIAAQAVATPRGRGDTGERRRMLQARLF